MKDILDISNTETWEPFLSEVLKKELGQLYYEQSLTDDVINKVKLAIFSKFEKIICYHSCKTNNIQSYYDNGIMPLSPDTAKQQFSDRYKTDLSCETKRNEVDLAIDINCILEFCGHYLIYGSEYQYNLVTKLPNCKQEINSLRNNGKATIFICGLLLTELELLAGKEDTKELVSAMINNHIGKIINKDNSIEPIDFTVSSSETITPEKILRHYHPERVKDPYNSYQYWNDFQKKYE